MTIDEAIKLLEIELAPFVTLSTHGTKDAIKLGIEALKRIQRQRKDLFTNEIKLLPGEAEK
jgi:hypothetical protein